MGFISNEKLYYALALAKIEGVGAVNAKKIESKYPNLSELFVDNSSRNFHCDGVPSVVFDRIKSFKDFNEVEDEMQFILDNNIDVLLLSDADFPADLKECYDAPFLLFSKGKINFDHTKILSIVGTRNITSYGKIL